MTRRNKRKVQYQLWPLLIAAFVLTCWILQKYGFLGGDDSAKNVFSEAVKEKVAVSFLDVGQGDSTLIKTPNEEYILIDAGTNESENNLAQTLHDSGVETIAYAIFTHPHEDHIGGGDMVINQCNVEHAILPQTTTNTATQLRLLQALDDKRVDTIAAIAGKSYEIDGVTLTILAPITIDEDNLNNDSIVIRMTYEDIRFLFCGDAEAAEEMQILQQYDLPFLQADVIKIGHHGSSTSTTQNFLDAVSPSLAVISCGKDNDYGHPHSQTLQKLKDRAIPVKRTDQDGCITVATDGSEIEVLNQKVG